MRISKMAAGLCVWAFLIGMPLGGGALGQSAPNGVLTPAPVPNRGPAEVTPSERVERPNGAERAAPFSGLPSSVEGDRAETQPGTLGEVGRRGTPVPSLSK